MWEILKAKVSEISANWVKGVIIYFLGMMTVYYGMSFRAAVTQANIVIAQLQHQIQNQSDALNGQCQDVLKRQGFIVEKPKPQPPKEEEVKEDGGEEPIEEQGK